MPGAPPVLSYVDRFAGSGFDPLSNADPRLRRVMVPPVSSWRSLGPLWVWTRLLGGVLAVVWVAAIFDKALFLVALILWMYLMLPLAIMAVVMVRRRYQQLIFEITPDVLRLITAGPFGTHHTEWPRAMVVGMFISPLTMKLRIRIAGHDPRSVYLGPDRVANDVVLHELIAAQTAIPPAPVVVVRPPDDGRLTMSRLFEPQKKEFWA